MTVLHIYKLEDLKQTQAVSTLHNGEHLIGRDIIILKCTDNSVSRKHAMIIITEYKVTLKSLHFNPCFYKAAKGSMIVLVKKDESVVLNDGDQFALYADTYWFKVRVLFDKGASGLTIKQNDRQCEKVCNVTETSEVPTPSTSCLQNVNRLLNTSLNADETKIDTSQLISNLKVLIEVDFGDAKNICDKEESNDSMDFDESFEKEPSDSLGTEEIAPAVYNDETFPWQTVQIDKVESKVEITRKTRESLIEINNDESFPWQTVQVDQVEDKVKIAGKTKESLIEIKNALAEEKSVVVETKDDDKANSANEAGPSTSTDKPNTRRERCWYASKCYRKNPEHWRALSHPGDDDYKSDPEDDQPVCPFGASCYRTNVNHRQVYKHFTPPSVRKPAGDEQPKQLARIKDGNVSESDESSRQDTADFVARKKRKAAVKKDDSDSESDKDSEKDAEVSGKRRKRKAAKKVKNLNDDYDFDDPFVNDASSDDFEPTDDDSDDTTDWDDSQSVDEESQERKRLLTEANKFTKAKKRKKS